MKHKFEMEQLLNYFFANIKIQLNTQVQLVQFDNGSEFFFPIPWLHSSRNLRLVNNAVALPCQHKMALLKAGNDIC